MSLFKKSTRDIVTGGRKARVESTPEEITEAAENPEAPADPEAPGTSAVVPGTSAEPKSSAFKMPDMKHLKVPIIAIAGSIVAALLIVLAVTFFSGAAKLPEGTILVSVADVGLGKSAKPGDIITIYSNGKIVPELQYVEVYDTAGGGGVLAALDSKQSEAWLKLGTVKAILVSHRDRKRAKTLLDLQKRINNPEITLALPEEVTLNLGGSKILDLTTEIDPVEAVVPEIRYIVENTDIVTVQGKGLLLAHDVGDTTVKVICGSAEAQCVVHVRIPLGSIELNHKEATLAVGDTLQLVGTPVPENASDVKLTLTSENPEIAQVAEDGTITAVGAGTTNIVVSCGKVTAKCSVTVGYHPEVIGLDRQVLNLTISDSEKLTITTYPGENIIDPIQVESSSPGVVVATPDGTILGMMPGQTVVTFRCGEAAVSCQVTVTTP